MLQELQKDLNISAGSLNRAQQEVMSLRERLSKSERITSLENADAQSAAREWELKMQQLRTEMNATIELKVT